MIRRASSYHYQTFPTTPPATRGTAPDPNDPDFDPSDALSPQDSASTHAAKSAAQPTKQLIVLAILSLCEQTALNSISPYLPAMAGTFPEVDGNVGLYVGVIASSFAAAQFATNVFWGRISDRIGRKPVIMLGTFLTALCFVMFGFCRTLWQAIVVQALTGLVNANAGIVSTVLGEITDKSNQSSAFAYLPIVYGIGGIMGPIVGGALVNTDPSDSHSWFAAYPYLLPNLVSTVVLLAGFLLTAFMLEESLQEAQNFPALSSRAKELFTWVWAYLRSFRRGPTPTTPLGESPELFPELRPAIPYAELFTPQIILLLTTFTIFNLSNIAFNSLYPIYASAPYPIGRALEPREIGISLGFAGAVACIFQGVLFTRIQGALGNRWCYRIAFFGLCISLFAMPFVGRTDHSKLRLAIELGSALLLKTIATVGGLTCAMLLITNASPKSSTLGTLNGIAQTLSAGGRAIGPLVSGGLFTASDGVKNGEFISWWVFGGVACVGAACACVLHGRNLEGHEGEPLLDEETQERGG